MTTRLLLLAVALLTAAGNEPVLILRPNGGTVVGGAMRILCRVPRYAANRWVRWGFEDCCRTAERQLDGEQAAVTHEMLVEEVPCEPGAVFCEVRRAAEPTVRVERTITILGCDGS